MPNNTPKNQSTFIGTWRYLGWSTKTLSWGNEGDFPKSELNSLFLNVLHLAHERQVAVAASTLSLQNVIRSDAGHCGRVVFYQQELLGFIFLPEQKSLGNICSTYQPCRGSEGKRLCLAVLPIMEHDVPDALICLGGFFRQVRLFDAECYAPCLLCFLSRCRRYGILCLQGGILGCSLCGMAQDVFGGIVEELKSLHGVVREESVEVQSLHQSFEYAQFILEYGVCRSFIRQVYGNTV